MILENVGGGATYAENWETAGTYTIKYATDGSDSGYWQRPENVEWLDNGVGLYMTASNEQSVSFATFSPFSLDVMGDFDATYAIDNGVIFDVGGGFVLGRDFALAVAYTRFNRDDDGSVDARIPHPFFFNRDRAIAGSAANLGRTEHGVHLQVRWFAPVPGPFEVVVFGGPTFFNVRQDLVTSVGFSHSFPFNEASFTTASIARRSDSAVGYNVGADVSYFFSPHIGVGGLARFTRGSVDLASEDSGLVSTDAGGFHTGGGLRLRF